MTNKTKKSKWLKLALISTASLSTLATIPAAICAKSAVKTSTPTVDTNLGLPVYYNVTFTLQTTDKDAGAKIVSGPTVSRVKKGRQFGLVEKPIVTKPDCQFIGWYTHDEGGNEKAVNDTDVITSNMTVFAKFVNASSIVVKGDTTVALGSTATYTAITTPEQKVKWYVNDGTEIPVDEDDRRVPSSAYAAISTDSDTNKGILTTKQLSTGTDKTYVFAIPDGQPIPASIVSGASNVLEIKVIDSSETYADKILTTVGEQTYYFEPSALYTTSGTMELKPIISTEALIPIPKTEFNYPITFGKNVSTIQDNFLPINGTNGFIAFNNTITFNNVVHIGNNFLCDNTIYDQPITFPSSLKYIGDNFLLGCQGFKSAISFGATPAISHIGNRFMQGCKSFAKTLVLPETLAEIGTHFMYNCDAMHTKSITIKCPILAFASSTASFAVDNIPATEGKEHKINVLCLGQASFEEFEELFPSETGDFVRNGVNRIDWTGHAVLVYDESNDVIMYSADLESTNICATAGNITFDTWTCPRNIFNLPIYINPNTTTIGDNFLANCFEFNQPLNLPNVTSVGRYFLGSTDIESIMRFNSQILLPQLQTIGSYFLLRCQRFNQPLELPELTAIGAHFLSYCGSFNQDIILPPTLTGNDVIDQFFMHQCQNMTSKVIIQCHINAFKHDEESGVRENNFITNWDKASSYVYGIQIDGLNDTDFATFHGWFNDKDQGPYRKIKKAEQPQIAIKFAGLPTDPISVPTTDDFKHSRTFILGSQTNPIYITKDGEPWNIQAEIEAETYVIDHEVSLSDSSKVTCRGPQYYQLRWGQSWGRPAEFYFQYGNNFIESEDGHLQSSITGTLTMKLIKNVEGKKILVCSATAPLTFTNS